MNDLSHHLFAYVYDTTLHLRDLKTSWCMNARNECHCRMEKGRAYCTASLYVTPWTAAYGHSVRADRRSASASRVTINYRAAGPSESG